MKNCYLCRENRNKSNEAKLIYGSKIISQLNK